MAQFQEERLIRLLNVTRKLSLCNIDYQLQVLPQLARVFDTDAAPCSLMDIIVSGLCRRNIYEKISAALYDQIQSILPSEKQLNLKDSVYESRLVETVDERNETESAIKKKRKLPITLLRIPTDLQCHLFHYLHYKDLMEVQKVCRALCIAARNPSALYSLEIKYAFEFNPRSPKTIIDWPEIHYFHQEWFSKPKVLSLHFDADAMEHAKLKLVIGNSKWGQNVVDLRMSDITEDLNLRKLVPFQKLERCRIYRSISTLLNGLITSYHTLKQLTLYAVIISEEVINEIQKFHNLEELSLSCMDSNPDQSDVHQCSDPISFPKLKKFVHRVQNRDFRYFQRILIGFNPETVFDINAEALTDYQSVSESQLAIPEKTHIQQMILRHEGHKFFDAMNKWLCRAKSSNSKIFDNITAQSVADYDQYDMSTNVHSVIGLFQHANRSKLSLLCTPHDLPDIDGPEAITQILNAPFGTFTEIEVCINFELFIGNKRDDNQYYIGYLLDCMDYEECAERDQETVRNVILESVSDAEKWMEPWLVFDEEQMKQIGLQKLDIKLHFSSQHSYCALRRATVADRTSNAWSRKRASKTGRCDRAFAKVRSDCSQERVGHWNAIGQQNIRATIDKTGEEGYTVQFLLNSNSRHSTAESKKGHSGRTQSQCDV